MSESHVVKPDRDDAARALAAVQVVSGAIGAVFALVSGWSLTVTRSPSEIQFSQRWDGGSFLLAAYLAVMVYAGVQLWRASRIGYALSAVIFAVQIVRIDVSYLQFVLRCPGGIAVGWILDGPATGLLVEAKAGISFHLGLGSTVVEDPAITINVVALAVLIFLIRRLIRPPAVVTSGQADHFAR